MGVIESLPQITPLVATRWNMDCVQMDTLITTHLMLFFGVLRKPQIGVCSGNRVFEKCRVNPVMVD
jgi:hypothetical protein